MKATREQVLAMAGLAKGRLMHEQNQHELICFAEDDLEAFAHKLQQFTLDQLRVQGEVASLFTPNQELLFPSEVEPHTRMLRPETYIALYRIPETLE